MMTYRVMTLATIAWIAVWLAPYLYAVNDLITWRLPSSPTGLIVSSQVLQRRPIPGAVATERTLVDVCCAGRY